jgi:hypothetical protein
MTDIEFIRDKLEQILVQTTRTNGKVIQLQKDMLQAEKNIDDLIATRNETKGRDRVLYILLVVIGTVLGFFMQHLISKT